ncbi:hypothetical protein LC55x_4072 [Lysobacter capsici]|nr:hypothetical protein LC55x_4072 [Lysobacter capsici]
MRVHSQVLKRGRAVQAGAAPWRCARRGGRGPSSFPGLAATDKPCARDRCLNPATHAAFHRQGIRPQQSPATIDDTEARRWPVHSFLA